MTFTKHLADGLKPVMDLVYPPRCPLCGDATAEQGGLCVECWSGIEVPGEPSCPSCCLPIGRGRSLCHACEVEPPRYSGIHTATIYNDASRQLILSFKHGGKIALAGMLARMMGQRLPAANGAEPLLVPVPLHRWRLWRRGYNQAGLLARELGKLGKGELLVDGLVRRKRTPSLGGLGRAARRKAVEGSIAIHEARRGRLIGRDVILVDDVLTSGATANACTTALLEAGAVSVRIACFARVVDGLDMPQNTTPEAITAPGAT